MASDDELERAAFLSPQSERQTERQPRKLLDCITRAHHGATQQASRSCSLSRLISCGLLTALLFVFLASRPLFGTLHHNFDNSLRFTKLGTFQISVFEDLHFAENAWEAWGPQQDVKTIRVIEAVLEAESPQLVVLNGDLITGENTYRENSTHYIDQLVAPFVRRALPWASAYGNHDSSYNLSRHDILARERQWPNALTKQMVFTPEAGVSNYYLPILPSNGDSVPSLLLWFFDSRGGHHFQQRDASGAFVPQPNWVDQSVVDWFMRTSTSLARQYNRTIPSLAFVHIPTNASRAVQMELGINPHRQPGINDDYVLAGQAQGWCPGGRSDEACEYGGQDVPFMEAIASTPGLLVVFSGHDHGDSWCYRWDALLPGMAVQGNGVNLCFGQRSGYGGYGTWTRGSRQISISESMLEEREVETWIRLETGDVVGSVVLNSTYGRDKYPATPNTHSSKQN